MKATLQTFILFYVSKRATYWQQMVNVFDECWAADGWGWFDGPLVEEENPQKSKEWHFSSCSSLK